MWIILRGKIWQFFQWILSIMVYFCRRRKKNKQYVTFIVCCCASFQNSITSDKNCEPLVSSKNISTYTGSHQKHKHFHVYRKSPKRTISNYDQYFTVHELRSTLSNLVKYDYSEEFDYSHFQKVRLVRSNT